MSLASLVLAFLVIVVIWTAFSFGRFAWAAGTLHGGDYDRTLGRIRLLKRLTPRSPDLLFLEGTALLFANRMAEAEASLRASIAAEPRNPTGWVNLGWLLSDVGRYEEAVEALETAIRRGPGWGSAHCALAEVWLRQGLQPERALALCDEALELHNSVMARHADRHVVAYILGNRAWALALLGRAAEVSDTLERAFREANRESRPGMAGLHWRAGMALAALGDPGAADHFRKAQEIDPGGKYGAQAAAAVAG